MVVHFSDDVLVLAKTGKFAGEDDSLLNLSHHKNVTLRGGRNATKCECGGPIAPNQAKYKQHPQHPPPFRIIASKAGRSFLSVIAARKIGKLAAPSGSVTATQQVASCGVLLAQR